MALTETIRLSNQVFLSWFISNTENMNRWKVSKAKVARARSISELNAEISTALSENAAGIEKIFEEIDELNHGWLTIESLYQARVKKSIH